MPPPPAATREECDETALAGFPVGTFPSGGGAPPRLLVQACQQLRAEQKGGPPFGGGGLCYIQNWGGLLLYKKSQGFLFNWLLVQGASNCARSKKGGPFWGGGPFAI